MQIFPVAYKIANCILVSPALFVLESTRAFSYGLGRMAGEHEQQQQGNDSMNPDTITPLSQGGDDPGMNDPADTFGEGPDFGGFSGEGADFGGGDFGGGSDW